MKIEHPQPTISTIKFLYAHAYRCAFENCKKPLYRIDEQTGERILNSRICHINARSEGGPRWDPMQSSAANRSKENLILLCLEHASAIDEPVSWSTYSSDLLKTWKLRQIEDFDRMQGWKIDSAMAIEAMRGNIGSSYISIANSAVRLGGEGGNKPGGGGGGGGAIGLGARGGNGGLGGGVRIDAAESIPRWALDNIIRIISNDDELTESIEQVIVPGSGGAGGGAVGAGTRGGDGGGGGENTYAFIDLQELKAEGLDRVEIVVGQGGRGGSTTLPGHHGEPGEDTVLNFLRADGTSVKSVRASAGQNGRAGASNLPEGFLEFGCEDMESDFHITCLMPVNAAEIRDGLVFVLGGSWIRYPVSSLPSEGVWSVLCTASWRKKDWGSLRGIFLSLMNPADREVSCLAMTISEQSVETQYAAWLLGIGAIFDSFGTWTLKIHSGGYILCAMPILVHSVQQ